MFLSCIDLLLSDLSIIPLLCRDVELYHHFVLDLQGAETADESATKGSVYLQG